MRCDLCDTRMGSGGPYAVWVSTQEFWVDF